MRFHGFANTYYNFEKKWWDMIFYFILISWDTFFGTPCTALVCKINHPEIVVSAPIVFIFIVKNCSTVKAS